LNPSQVSIGNFGRIGDLSIAGLANANYYAIAHNSLYYAINGSNQQSFLANGNAAYVINSIIGRMRAGQSLLFNGTFLLDSSIIPISNTYLDLRNATIQATVGSLRAIDIYGSSGTHKTNITINGGHFIGHNATSGDRAIRGFYADKITVVGATFDSVNSGIAVECQYGKGNVIQDNTFLYNPGSYAIVFNDGSDGIITRNNISSGLNGAGIGIFSYTGSERNCTLSYNTITGWGQYPDQGWNALWHAIYVAGTPDTQVYGNIISNPSSSSCGVAVLIKSANTDVYNNTVNAVQGWHVHIYQEDAPDYNSPNGTRIHNNTFTGSNVGGIYLAPRTGYSVSNIEITSNTFSNLNQPVTVDASSATTQAINTLIQNNTFSSSQFGVRVGFYGQLSYADGINITDNLFNSISPNAAVIIESGTTHGAITYNTFSSCTTNIQNKASDTIIFGNKG
jgi:hypothetical protein